MTRLVALFTLACINLALAMDYSVELNQVSSSGKTVLVNKGYNDQIKTDDYGILLAKTRVENQATGQTYSVYRPVAKLKAVRTLSNSSIWIAFKVFIPNELKKGAKLLLLSETALLTGRTDLKIENKTVVGKKAQIAKNLKETLIDDGDFLAKKAKEYEDGDLLVDREKHFDSDVTLVNLDIWEEGTLEGTSEYQGFYESPHAEVFAQRHRVHTFEKMAAAFIKKNSREDITKATLYADQKRDPNVPEFQARSLRGSYHDRSAHESYLRKEEARELRAELLEKGESWSDEYSDEELGQIVYKVGVVNEQDRVSSIGAKRFNYQVYGSFGLNLLNNENLSDRENTEPTRYDIEGAFEWFFTNKRDKPAKFSVELSARRSKDSFTTGDFNATSVEYSGAAHLNWYPFYSPNTIGKNIIYVGTLFRYGWARREIPSLGEKGDYQVMSFPGVRAGIKYNFANGYGVRATGAFENILSDRIIRTEDEGELPDRIGHLEGKLSIGLSRFF
ncbi:MAG: hypothetical protein KC478_01815 [Bacteriovoracaceae bacterium]|nr:hypothetical protein [Bacteriovoracaceae bacterium]